MLPFRCRKAAMKGRRLLCAAAVAWAAPSLAPAWLWPGLFFWQQRTRAAGAYSLGRGLRSSAGCQPNGDPTMTNKLLLALAITILALTIAVVILYVVGVIPKWQ